MLKSVIPEGKQRASWCDAYKSLLFNVLSGFGPKWAVLKSWAKIKKQRLFLIRAAMERAFSACRRRRNSGGSGPGVQASIRSAQMS